MNEIELIEKIRDSAVQILQETDIVKVVDYATNKAWSQLDLLRSYGSPDIVMPARARTGETILLVFEVKMYGQPRYALQVADRFNALKDSTNNAWYGVFGAPYLSKKTMGICRDNEIGCIDLAGNCFLKFDGVYINVQGRRNPYPDKRPLKSVFYPKSTRVIRALLSNPGREWLVKDLKDEAGVSIGQASNVKSRLLDYEFIEEVDRQGRTGFLLKDPIGLLNEWAKNYSYRKNLRTNYYSFEDTKTIEETFAKYCRENGIRYAFTLTSGANLIAPFLRYKRVFTYVDGPTEPIAQSLDWNEVSSGSNISLIRPYDESVLKDLQEINGKKVVSDIQLYLDLQGYEQRGTEAAEQILKRVEEKW